MSMYAQHTKLGTDRLCHNTPTTGKMRVTEDKRFITTPMTEWFCPWFGCFSCCYLSTLTSGEITEKDRKINKNLDVDAYNTST